jgi:hypothetical protein
MMRGKCAGPAVGPRPPVQGVWMLAVSTFARADGNIYSSLWVLAKRVRFHLCLASREASERMSAASIRSGCESPCDLAFRRPRARQTKGLWW